MRWTSLFFFRQFQQLTDRAPVTRRRVYAEQFFRLVSELRDAESLRRVEVEHLVRQRELLALRLQLIHRVELRSLRWLREKEQVETLRLRIRLRKRHCLRRPLPLLAAQRTRIR